MNVTNTIVHVAFFSRVSSFSVDFLLSLAPRLITPLTAPIVVVAVLAHPKIALFIEADAFARRDHFSHF